MIVRCICKHETQDRIHGTQNRVMNPTKDPSKGRCLVCKLLVNISNKEKDANNEKTRHKL